MFDGYFTSKVKCYFIVVINITEKQSHLDKYSKLKIFASS